MFDEPVKCDPKFAALTMANLKEVELIARCGAEMFKLNKEDDRAKLDKILNAAVRTIAANEVWQAAFAFLQNLRFLEIRGWALYVHWTDRTAITIWAAAIEDLWKGMGQGMACHFVDGHQMACSEIQWPRVE